MVEYEVRVDDKEVRLAFDKLYHRTPYLSRKLLGRLSEAVISHTVRNKLSGQVLHRRTGTLAKSLNWKLTSDFSATIGTNVAYAAIHEFGGEIRPRNAKALSFQIGDTWVRTQKVTMPKRPYLGPGLEEVFNRGEAQRIMDDTTREYLNKEWE